MKKDGAEIGLREELRPLIDNPVMVCQMKDVIDYRAMDYYQRRYSSHRKMEKYNHSVQGRKLRQVL